MRFAALIGANHAHQYPGHRHGNSDTFESFVTRVATQLQVDLLAEEMSREALDNAKVSHSSVNAVSDRMQLPHILCDPDSAERCELGIPSYDELKKRRGFNYVYAEEARMLESDERSFWSVREREWLRRLGATPHQRVLFVLGPNHVQSFQQLLAVSGYKVEIVCLRWEA